MKTSKFLMIALLALGLSGVSCKKSPPVKVSHTSMPTAPVELKLDWPLGRHALQSFDMKIGVAMNIPGMAQPMNQDITMAQDTALTVTKEMDGGKHEVEMEYLNTKMSVAAAGKKVVDYDSSKKSEKGTDPGIAAMGKMVGAKIQFILDASNRVESVQGIDDLQGRMTSVIKGDQSGMLKTFLSADTLKQMMDHAASLPGKAVKPGDSWPVQREFSMGPLGTMESDFTFTLNSWEKRNDRWCARIGMDGTMTNKPSDTADTALPGMKIAVSDGTCSGETWFDIDMGMFVETKLNNDMKLAITVPMGPPRKTAKKTEAPKTQTITADMHQAMTTKFELK
jgi:hypothetical protein